MAVTRRKRADQTTLINLPKLPLTQPPDWPPTLYAFLRDLVRTLENNQTIIFAIQDNGTDQPLRAVLNFTSGVTITDSPDNDRLDISVP